MTNEIHILFFHGSHGEDRQCWFLCVKKSWLVQHALSWFESLTANAPVYTGEYLAQSLWQCRYYDTQFVSMIPCKFHQTTSFQSLQQHEQVLTD